MAERGESSKDDDELSIPRAAVNKYIKDLVPNLRVSADARELILNCCTEFIHLISSEANDICTRTQRKTISPDNILEALETLGFGAYRSDVGEVLQDCKAVAAKKRKASNRLENQGIPEEELLRQQQLLFAQAREEQALLEQQKWQRQQAAVQAMMTQQQQQAASKDADDDDDDYS